MEKMLIYKLWEYVCNGDIEKLKKYYSEHNEINRRYCRFNKEHSLIMGALRNNQFETVEYLISVGETITNEEKEQILTELKRIDIIKKIVNKEEIIWVQEQKKII